MVCAYEGCTNKRQYCIEWQGLNQYGKRPVVVQERFSCFNPERLIALSHHEHYGGYPDEINDRHTFELKKDLLTFVKKSMDGDLNKETLDNLTNIFDPPKEQESLF